MATANLARRPACEQLALVLELPHITKLIERLEGQRWTGRPGYPVRALVGACLVKALYAIPTWSRTAALIAEHDALARVLGDRPSVYACYRFSEKLRRNRRTLHGCIDEAIAALRERYPEFGRDVAIDASDMPAYGNGHRYRFNRNGPKRKRYSDPDASWGYRSSVSTRRGGGFYGFKLQAAVCTKTGLPIAWEVATAKANESLFVAGLLDRARARGIVVETMTADKAYDNNRVYAECAERDCQPIIPVRQTSRVRRGDHLPPSCEHGPWQFAGSDHRRGASKWRCPTGECTPASTWVSADRLHPLIPRETPRWKDLYRARSAIEREFGRLKHEWSLLPLRVRGRRRVQLHADLTILTRLSCALVRAEASRGPRPGSAAG